MFNILVAMILQRSVGYGYYICAIACLMPTISVMHRHALVPCLYLSNIHPPLAGISLIIPGLTRGRECDPGKLPHSLKFPHTYLTLTGSGGDADESDRTGSGHRGLVWIEEAGATV